MAQSYRATEVARSYTSTEVAQSYRATEVAQHHRASKCYAVLPDFIWQSGKPVKIFPPSVCLSESLSFFLSSFLCLSIPLSLSHFFPPCSPLPLPTFMLMVADWCLVLSCEAWLITLESALTLTKSWAASLSLSRSLWCLETSACRAWTHTQENHRGR